MSGTQAKARGSNPSNRQSVERLMSTDSMPPALVRWKSQPPYGHNRDLIAHPTAPTGNRDPGSYGLALSIGTTPTAQLLEQVRVLDPYVNIGGTLGYAARRRRQLAIVEISSRAAVPR